VRFIVMHKTNARWEAGEIPSPELIENVGALIGDLVKAGVFRAGEGLRASAEGVRVRFAEGGRTVTAGPFEGANELPAGFTILRTSSIDEAVEWASREAAVLGDVEIDVRPVTEAWDIGMAPKPEKATTRRYMALRKATAASEAGISPSLQQRAALARLAGDGRRAGVHLAAETLRPSARGRRYKNTREGVRVIDGPFSESKELIAGYIIVEAGSLDEAGRIAERYLDVVEAAEVDVRELEDEP
jgi:hypothetical protein